MSLINIREQAKVVERNKIWFLSIPLQSCESSVSGPLRQFNKFSGSQK